MNRAGPVALLLAGLVTGGELLTIWTGHETNERNAVETALILALDAILALIVVRFTKPDDSPPSGTRPTRPDDPTNPTPGRTQL